MTKINIHQMNFDPFVDKNNKRIKEIEEEKSKIVKRVFRSYKKYFDEDVDLGNVYMHSFKPKDKDVFGKYTDFRFLEVEDPGIFIISSIYDLERADRQAFGRLIYALSLDNIKAVYISDYSLDIDVSEYLDVLQEIFYSGRGSSPKVRRYEIPNELRQAVIDLRRFHPPTMLDDISKYTGLEMTMVRKIAGKEAYNVGEGIPITPERIDHINKEYKKAKDKEYDRFVIREEKFIK